MLSYRTYYNGADPQSGIQVDVLNTLRGGNYPNGYEIIEVSRSNVKNKTQYEVNWPVEDYWESTDFYNDPVLLLFAIFEYDPWPEGTQTSVVYTFGNPTTARYLTYRSADPAYYYGKILSNTNGGTYSYYDATSFYINLSGIEFNMESY